MNTARYTDTCTATGGAGKYPLSTETLDFIQTQIKLLEHLAGVGGKNYILPGPGGRGGVVALTTRDKGMELLELMDSPAFSSSIRYITVTTTPEDIVADAETYVEARTYRRAQYTTDEGAESYDIGSFANVSNKTLGAFPTNAALAAQIKNMPAKVLEYLKDVLASKLTAKALKNVSKAQIDGLRTACVLSCADSHMLFGSSDYTLIVTEQGKSKVRQELVQGDNIRYVRTGDRDTWGPWKYQAETAMHLEVKIVDTAVYVRHGDLPADCDIVLLRKKKRGPWRRTGGVNADAKNRGIRKRRSPKTQYVHFKGIRLGKGTPGQWYVPKCISVCDRIKDGKLVGKELPGLCKSFFYPGGGGFYRIQGSRKRIALKTMPNAKNVQHAGYVPIGLQIARIKGNGGKDSGGEIVRMKYRISQQKAMDGEYGYAWRHTFSIE